MHNIWVGSGWIIWKFGVESFILDTISNRHKNSSSKKNSQDLQGQFNIKYIERIFLGIEIVAVIKWKRSWVI